MNIVMILTLFPSFDVKYDDPRTKFLYFYAAEWTKQGHKVLVLHSVPRYPRLFSQAMDFLEKRLGLNLRLSRFRQHSQAVKLAEYKVDGIQVIRTPICKLIPHRDFMPWDIARHQKLVLKRYQESGFKADLVISDSLTPSAYIAKEIRQSKGIPFYQGLHQTDFSYLTRSNIRLCKALEQASGILFHSYSHVQRLNRKGFMPAYCDFMFIGIPNDISIGSPRMHVKKLLFVGRLLKSKNVHVILEAIAASRGRTYYELEIVGEGPYEESLKALIVELGLQEQVIFSGRLPRGKVFEKMRGSDCLIMVSMETYGMVYIEAISQGCVVVAAKDQGVDGIIVNGENGYLVECGNVKELTELLDRLMQLDKQEVKRITENGIQTARQMTDGQLAKDLLERLNIHLKSSEGNVSNC